MLWKFNKELNMLAWTIGSKSNEKVAAGFHPHGCTEQKEEAKAAVKCLSFSDAVAASLS